MGKKKQKPLLTPLELRIMQILWSSGPLNVQAVQQKLGDDLAYTTVQTMLNVLNRKGHVARELVSRAYEYRPLHNQETARRSAVHDLLNRMFEGSGEALVMNMLRTKQIDAEKLASLIEKFDASEGDADAKSR
jgi:predicted transcriptional regulator